MENVFVINAIINIGECQSYVELYANLNDADKAYRKYVKKVDKLFKVFDCIKITETKGYYEMTTQGSSFAVVKITKQSIK